MSSVVKDLSGALWMGSGELSIRYHDEEWGVPVHDDRTLFEFLILEGAQAGLSWSTILNKRENYRKAFDGFDPVARRALRPTQDGRGCCAIPALSATNSKSRRPSAMPRRSCKCKKSSAVSTVTSGSSLAASHVVNSPKSMKQVPARTSESDAMSKDLKKRGFNFVGSTICYAFMQAVGMVNDHVVGCFRYEELR